jgi:hypothetical protein
MTGAVTLAIVLRLAAVAAIIGAIIARIRGLRRKP